MISDDVVDKQPSANIQIDRSVIVGESVNSFTSSGSGPETCLGLRPLPAAAC